MGLTQVNSEGIKDGEIKDADVNASAAIAGSKLAAATTSAAGSMSAADKTKLDGVATSATANPSAPALTGSTNNQITTVTGANAIQGEANLTFDGSDLALSRSDNAAGGISVTNTNDAQASGIAQLALSGGDNSYANISLEAGGNNHHIKNDNSGNLDILDGTTNRLRIDSNGIITPKAASNRGGIAMMGAFMANPSAVYNQNSGTAVIAFDDEQFDENGWYDHTTYTYTPLVKGWYQMNFFIQWKTGFNGNSIEVQAYYEKNGAAGPGPVEGYSTNYGNYAYVSWSPMVYFNGTTDYVKLVGNSSHNTQVSSVSEMSGYLVRPST